MNILENISLKEYNTFGIAVKAKFFVEIHNQLELQKTLQLSAYPEKFILSGGSNMLLTKDINALVLYINLKGISILEQNEESIILNVMAGENWHNLVLWTLDKNYGGLENLSLIPGNTGTAPIQNIGAYGVELKDVFVSCIGMHIKTQKLKEFSKEECKFGYRDSIFKNKEKGTYIITSVKLKLSKNKHKLNISYGLIKEELEKKNIKFPSIKDVSNAVIAIRENKLPDPKEIGNSGSFFKNPILSKKSFETFRKKNPEAPFYKMENKMYKIPAGWLIEKSGFKGIRFGDAGVHEKQALVLVNYGSASGEEIIDLARKIQKGVLDKFNISIVPEVNIIK